MSKEKNFISAVIYIHNAEKEGLKEFLVELSEFLRVHFEHFEIICVNDFSVDHSVEIIHQAGGSMEGIALTILNMSYFHGLEISMNAGVDLAIGDFVLEIDTVYRDYQLDEIMNVYNLVLEGSDIVSASSNKPERTSSKLFYRVFEHFSSGNVKMQTETFRILSRRAINRINGMSRTVPYRKALYATCGFKTSNYQYCAIENSFASSPNKQTRQYRNDLAVNSLLLFTSAGYVFSKWMSYLMMGMTLFMLVYTVTIYCMSKPVAGWTTTLLFLSIAFFGLFVILTIIIKYLQILLELSFRRNKYSFESIEKIAK